MWNENMTNTFALTTPNAETVRFWKVRIPLIVGIEERETVTRG
jgi:hypothetical protein